MKKQSSKKTSVPKKRSSKKTPTPRQHKVDQSSGREPLVAKPVFPQEPPRYEIWRNELEKGFQAACEFLKSKGLKETVLVELYIEEVRKAKERGESFQFGSPDEKGWKWMIAVTGWAHYEAKGPDEALNRLPTLFQLDCDFFLRQPWISKLLASWHKEGDEKKIHHAFFGTRRRGIRSYKLSVDNYHRNLMIYGEVCKLLGSYGYRETMRQVAKNLKNLGIKETLSPSAIRTIHKKFDFIKPPYLALFSYS
jgi:hypothetical protein